MKGSWRRSRRWPAAVLDGLVEALEGQVGVALPDRVNFSTFWPMVPSAISGNAEVGHVAREVKTPRGALPYDYLVLAPGRTRRTSRACGTLSGSATGS